VNFSFDTVIAGLALVAFAVLVLVLIRAWIYRRIARVAIFIALVLVIAFVVTRL